MRKIDGALVMISSMSDTLYLISCDQMLNYHFVLPNFLSIFFFFFHEQLGRFEVTHVGGLVGFGISDGEVARNGQYFCGRSPTYSPITS